MHSAPGPVKSTDTSCNACVGGTGELAQPTEEVLDEDQEIVQQQALEGLPWAFIITREARAEWASLDPVDRWAACPDEMLLPIWKKE